MPTDPKLKAISDKIWTLKISNHAMALDYLLGYLSADIEYGTYTEAEALKTLDALTCAANYANGRANPPAN